MTYLLWRERVVDECSEEDMKKYCASKIRKKIYRPGMWLSGKNRMSTYKYKLSKELANKSEDLRAVYLLKNGQRRTFDPKYHPREMLAMGVFGGKILNDCLDEFPVEWFADALRKGKISPMKAREEINYFGVKSRQSLQKWRESGWIVGDDERGWFQWFCRYALGRRDKEVDTVQMKRWASIRRWKTISDRNPNNKKIKQLLLQWSWPCLP